MNKYQQLLKLILSVGEVADGIEYKDGVLKLDYWQYSEEKIKSFGLTPDNVEEIEEHYPQYDYYNKRFCFNID